MQPDKRARLRQWLAGGETSLHPVTYPQRELWEASAVPVADPANHICCLIHVRGLLVPRDGEAALRRVVERQEGLRISFLPGKERALQMVRQNNEPNLKFQTLSSGQCADEAVEEMAREIFCSPFDLVQGPLYRAVALRRASDDHVLVFAIHHAIADGWTLGVFVRELFASYLQGAMGDASQLPPVPLSYTAWGAAERAVWQPSALDRCASFWKTELAGTRRLWGSAIHRGPLRRWATHIPAQIGAGVRTFARRSGVTLFSTLLTAFQAALAEWSGADDFVVGAPVANRTKQAVHETMGYCSGTVPIRARVDRDRPFHESLRETHRTTVDCFAHAMPFAELVRALGETQATGCNPVFDVRFALQNHPIPDVALPTLAATLRMRSTGTARFVLGCEVTEQGDALEVVWLSCPERFGHAEIEDLHRLFQTLLGKACDAPERRIGTLAAILP